MTAPDLARARSFVEALDLPGRPLFCGVTGAHFFGFASPASELDLRGIYLAPTPQLLGLGGPADVLDHRGERDGFLHDLSLSEARQALDLLLRGNGNILERLFTPWQLYDTPQLAQLRQLARGTLSRKYFRHYQGFFRGMCREHERAERPTIKTLLHVYRVALTGVHLLQTGELIADLRLTAPEYGYPDVLGLIDRKRESGARSPAEPALDAHHRALWPRLAADLEQAHADSPLPDQPGNAGELSAWLVDLRLQDLRPAPA
jgi:predicted nucleotidyltransferase